MELGLLLKKWSKFGGIELQLLYSGKLWLKIPSIQVSSWIGRHNNNWVFCSFMKENRWWWVWDVSWLKTTSFQKMESMRFFLVEDYLLPDELWSAWGRSDNSYLDEMMDTVNILWRCWFQSQLDQYYTTVGLQPIEVFQISKMELGVSRKKRYWWNWYLSRENQDVGSLGNYNDPTQPGLLLGIVLFIFVIFY